LPLLLSIFLLVSLKLKAAHQINIVVFGAACIASAYGAELLLSFFPISTQRTVMSRLQDASDKKKYAADLKRKFGIDVDTRTGIEVFEDLKESGIDAVPIVTPSNHLFLEQADGSIKSAISVEGQEVMPLGAVSGKVTVLCNESGYWIDYRS